MRKHILTRMISCALMLSLVFASAPAEVFGAGKAPERPIVTKAAVYGNNNVKLQWSKAKGAQKYKVYRKKAGGRFVLVKTTTKRTYYSRNLAYGTRYSYKVKAIGKSGRAKTSKSRLTYTKPAKPIITAKVFDVNNVKVSWKKVKGAKSIRSTEKRQMVNMY